MREKNVFQFLLCDFENPISFRQREEATAVINARTSNNIIHP